MATQKPASTPNIPEPQLVVTREEARSQLEDRIASGNEMVLQTIPDKEQLRKAKHTVRVWHDYNSQLLGNLFTNSKLADEFKASAPKHAGMLGEPTFQADLTYFRATTQQAVNVLESIHERLGLFQEAVSVKSSGPQQPTRHQESKSTVFIVHGHDELARNQIVLFLRTLDLTPIILAEQPNRGQTIIEKIELYADQASFAIVLLTPDDLGHAKTVEGERPRARQNVVLELGYFIGKLGRAKTCALYKKGLELPDLELPSDFTGVVYTMMDDAGGWKLQLGRELSAAGFDIDLNRLK